MPMDDERLHEQRLKTFDILVIRVEGLMRRFGRPDSLSHLGDFSVLGDYWGYPQVKLGVHQLRLLHPDIIKQLQGIVRDFPGWEIVVTVAVRGHYDDWPDMGLYVRPHEIVDTLQRQYFPPEFRNLEYEGGRRSTEDQVFKERS